MKGFNLNVQVLKKVKLEIIFFTRKIEAASSLFHPNSMKAIQNVDIGGHFRAAFTGREMR